MKLICLAILCVLMLAGCAEKKIEITSAYIINPNWDEQANAIEIKKMKVKKDSMINPFSELSQSEILNKLEEDSLFRWYANAKSDQGETYKNKKIYFNRDNGFTWLDDVTGRRTRVLGNLGESQWYKFSRLVTYPYNVYIYIDSLNNLHRFDVNLANF